MGGACYIFDGTEIPHIREAILYAELFAMILPNQTEIYIKTRTFSSLCFHLLCVSSTCIKMNDTLTATEKHASPILLTG